MDLIRKPVFALRPLTDGGLREKQTAKQGRQEGSAKMTLMKGKSVCVWKNCRHEITAQRNKNFVFEDRGVGLGGGLTLRLDVVQQLPICKDREKSRAKSAAGPCCASAGWVCRRRVGDEVRSG